MSPSGRWKMALLFFLLCGGCYGISGNSWQLALVEMEGRLEQQAGLEVAHMSGLQ